LTNIVLANSTDQIVITFNYSNELAPGITVTAVIHTVPSPMTKISESTDTANALSQVKVSGAVHGLTLPIGGQATLSNGELINRVFPVRGWNS
jgi:hypothetical protein